MTSIVLWLQALTLHLLVVHIVVAQVGMALLDQPRRTATLFDLRTERQKRRAKR